MTLFPAIASRKIGGFFDHAVEEAEVVRIPRSLLTSSLAFSPIFCIRMSLTATRSSDGSYIEFALNEIWCRLVSLPIPQRSRPGFGIPTTSYPSIPPTAVSGDTVAAERENRDTSVGGWVSGIELCARALRTVGVFVRMYLGEIYAIRRELPTWSDAAFVLKDLVSHCASATEREKQLVNTDKKQYSPRRPRPQMRTLSDITHWHIAQRRLLSSVHKGPAPGPSGRDHFQYGDGMAGFYVKKHEELERHLSAICRGRTAREYFASGRTRDLVLRMTSQIEKSLYDRSVQHPQKSPTGNLCSIAFSSQIISARPERRASGLQNCRFIVTARDHPASGISPTAYARAR
ncbi:hypothetical protein K458DRAFT_408565 [Lentithecium fluviatile CBS 122367]|uniref:Uncharacterized protein n=1 Tax=Lentithecium fluviatile CBS 122367 TaxID=1168545 RepID=A0A6G1IKV2_9PLEO|nr:hypothetical protein K458DRAFT_408565 [Lentithecium fluviatile CBS 122367]